MAGRDRLTDEELVTQYRAAEAALPAGHGAEGPKADGEETLRAQIVSGIDGTLDAPWIVRKFISADNLRLLKAQRTYWQSAGTAELRKLLDLLNQEP
jgi:hypothetical protein